MTVSPGTRLGRYEIRSKIGEGGMGEVYLAKDTELERTVALKVLPANVAANQQRMNRFVQEAKAASALNHPNILTIHEIGRTDATRFIATEFIDGETLRQRMRNAPLKLGEVLDVAVQIASALSAAHAAGIIHRDIKPENIMRRHDGIVKVLDFGLAKLSEKTDTETVDAEAATKALVQTEQGVVMGTAAYMSPEQARGLLVDARTDIFSLGVVIYEMVAGQAPFGGTTRSDLIVALLEREPPPLARFTTEAPAELERIVMKALVKDREERYQTAKDLLIDLKRLKQKLDVDAEIERSATPEEFRVPPSGAWLSGAKTSPPKGGTRTGSDLARATSSAEYITNEIKRHKLAVIICLLALVAGIIGLGAYLHTRNTEVAIESIAVLPFVNQNNDPNTEYLSDGISESLINSLSQLPGVKVIARSSSFKYKGKDADPQEVARAFGVQAVLVGRVSQRGDNLLISAELVNASDKTLVWGDQYSRKLSDVLAVQEEISREVSENLRLKLTSEEKQRLTKRYTRNTEAYQLYLQGRYYLNNFEGLDEANKAINYFEQAIAIDPDYASAYAGLAEAYILLGEPFNVGLPPKEALREAKAAATKAVGIDDTLGEAHVSLAHVIELYDWDWRRAEREYKRAIELNPNNATAHRKYSIYLQAMGRHTEAMAEIKRAAELDPLADLIQANIGFIFFTARQYDQAIEQFQKVGHHIGLGWAYQQKKMYKEAIAELQKASGRGGREDLAVASLGYVYAASGKKGEAQKRLDELKERSKQRYVSPYLIAYPYIGLGERDQAFASLEKAYESHDQWMIWLKSDPILDSLRADPRFQDLLRRVGF